MPEEKNIIIHPVNDGVIDENVNLYPKTKWVNILDQPTIGSGVLTIKVNGVVLQTFSANQTTNAEVDISTVSGDYVPKDLSLIPTEINPSAMTLTQQNSAMIYIDNNGTPSKAKISSLDYSKITVQSSDNMDSVKTKDFAFITNN